MPAHAPDDSDAIVADGRGTRWREHREQRRVEILDAAVWVIQSSPIGTELSLQSVADRAGIRRNVLYRYFADKSELHREVNVYIADQLWAAFEPKMRLEGSTREIAGRVLTAIVGWVAENPALYYSIETEIGDGRRSEMQQRAGALSEQLVAVIRTGAELLGPALTPADVQALDLLAFGITGQVRGTLQHWATDLSADRGGVSKAAVAILMREAIVYLLEGQARVLKLPFDADAPLPML